MAFQPTIRLPSNINEFSSLSTSSQKKISNYVRSSLTLGRHLNRAIILTLGVTGQGKSKTINTLVDRDIFLVDKCSDGSTTEVVQRTSVESIDPKTGISITLSFDDSPGLDDTRPGMKMQLEALVKEYGQKYYPDVPHTDIARLDKSAHFRRKTYPNAILLVATWDSVKRNAESAIEKTIRFLAHSDLIDETHQNVIVVVTKALTFWSDYDDLSSEVKKKQQWKQDADEKAQIINDLRSKALSSSNTWQVVFVENGGGKNIHRTHRMLPNGELSHQNLFDTILKNFTEARDLVGIQALRPMTGAPSDSSRSEPTEREVLCQCPDRRASIGEKYEEAHRPANPAAVINSNLAAAKTRLGYAYNPVYTRFSRTPIVVFKDSDIQISPSSSQQREGMIYANASDKRNAARALQLQTDFTVRSVAGAGAHYSSTATSGSSTSSASHTFESLIITAAATLSTVALTPSDQIRKEIDDLPVWDCHRLSKEVKARYRAFFDKHGTHISVRVALGGVLRITSCDNFNAEQRTVLKAMSGKASVPVAAHIGADVKAAAARKRTEERQSTSGSGSISVFREGGNVVASELTSTVEDIFDHYHEFSRGSLHLQSWLQIRARWIAALQTDPVVCIDHSDTHYIWLHGLDEITLTQQQHLRHASDWYLRGPVGDDQPESESCGGPSEVPLPRDKNLKRVDDALSAHRSWWEPLKFWKWIP